MAGIPGTQMSTVQRSGQNASNGRDKSEDDQGFESHVTFRTFNNGTPLKIAGLSERRDGGAPGSAEIVKGEERRR